MSQLKASAAADPCARRPSMRARILVAACVSIRQHASVYKGLVRAASICQSMQLAAVKLAAACIAPNYECSSRCL